MKEKCATDEFCTKVALVEVESDAFGFLSSVFGKSYASCAFNRFTRKVEKNACGHMSAWKFRDESVTS